MMIGEEREKNWEDFEMFHPFLIDNLIKDTSSIEEDTIDIGV